MKKLLFVSGLLIITALAANAQVSISGSATSSAGVIYPVPVPPPIDAGFVQFSNLTIQSVSSNTIPAEILATTDFYLMPMTETGAANPTINPISSVKCLKFENENSAAGRTITCPTPSSTSSTGSKTYSPNQLSIAYPLYRIEVDQNTRLYLRDKTQATLSDFASGDKINVFGFYNSDGSIQAYIARNISKPVEKQFIQLNNVELVSISATTAPTTLVVVQKPTYPCYRFNSQGNDKQSFPCPMGVQSLLENPATKNLQPSQSLMPIWDIVRKYVINVDSQTIILNRARGRLSLTDLKIGDQLNIYGDTSDNSQTINADIIRDISQPAVASNYSGTITQVNSDGSFTFQTIDGEMITVKNPINVGDLINIKGIIDQAQKLITEISTLTTRKNQPVPLPMPQQSTTSPSR